MQQIQIDDIVTDTLPQLLRMEDRSSMAFSIEARVPLLDHKVVEYGLPLPDHLKISRGWSKFAMRQAMRGVVPDFVRLRRTKLRFAAPDRAWLMRDCGQMCPGCSGPICAAAATSMPTRSAAGITPPRRRARTRSRTSACSAFCRWRCGCARSTWLDGRDARTRTASLVRGDRSRRRADRAGPAARAHRGRGRVHIAGPESSFGTVGAGAAATRSRCSSSGRCARGRRDHR